ncbi:MAG: Panacea domain-containing protein [Leptospirillum sp.]
MTSAKNVASYFLSKSDEESGEMISNLKLQKLLYYAQGFHLALYDNPLFSENIEAWRHGPVVHDVYALYAQYKAGPIPAPEEFELNSLDIETREFLDEVYNLFGQYSAWRLRDMTHEEPPWKNAWGDGRRGSETISHQSMKEYFQTLIKEPDDSR